MHLILFHINVYTALASEHIVTILQKLLNGKKIYDNVHFKFP